ncbi:MAG: UDP-N-acetylmuramate--L-alanine ligase [Candidatus Dormibacteria bacterium]
MSAGERSVHVMGAGGAGASAAARLAVARGLRVTGCDSAESEVTRRLSDSGVPVSRGHSIDHLEGVSVLAYSPALPYMEHPDPEYLRARELGIARPWPELMAELTHDLDGIAVAGTHGKSTVSAMVSLCLTEDGQDPTCFVGAEVPALGGNLRVGNGRWFVFEADEFNRNFLAFSPGHLLLTRVEFDHPECFADLAAVESAFSEFVAQMRAPRTVIHNADSESARRVAAVTGGSESYRFSDGDDGGADWVGRIVQSTPGAMTVEVTRRGVRWAVLESPLSGRHNAENLTAACALAAAAGAGPPACVRALSSFTGVARRFQLIGEVGETAVVDDYAHHPSEVRAALEGARRRYPGHRLIAIFQPHTHARTSALFDETAESLRAADQVLIADVFVARDGRSVRVAPDDLARAVGPGARASGDLEGTARVAAAAAQGPTLLLFMGAGDITQSSRLALELLRRTEG